MAATVVDPELVAARAALERFCRVYRRTPSAPVPVEELADSLLGLRVIEVEGLGVSGMLVPARREILLDAAECRQAPPRRRFTIAHEIGHALLHAGDGSALYCRPAVVEEQPERPSDPREREANRFAADLLMPEPLIRAAAVETADCITLAAAFGVSDVAMGWRLYNLGLSAVRPASTT